jgi:hypothetical protein
MNFGAEVLDGAVRFRLWAPKMDSVWVVLNGGAPLPVNGGPVRAGMNW